MARIIRIELYKLFARKRSLIGFIALLVIILLSQAAMLLEGEQMHRFITSNLSDAFYMQGNLINGYLMAYLVLNFLWVHVPLLVVIVTGDLLSGESQGGTLRIMLTRPVGRCRIVAAKFIAASVYTLMLMVFFALLSLGLSIILFGKGDLMVILGEVNIFAENDVMWRFILAFAYGFIGMIAIASLSLLFSAMSNNSLGPIFITMAIIILFSLISTFDFSFFRAIRPFLFTSYIDSWQSFFTFDLNMKIIMRDAAILVFHSILFYFITLFYFERKDILS